jgi:hypothetical protein
MPTLPLAHAGQVFDLVPAEFAAGIFVVTVDREVVWDAEVDDEGSWDYQEATVRESLGTIEVDRYRDGLIEVRTRYNGGRTWVGDLTAAVAFLVEEGRPCTHGDARSLDERNVWECDDCGALFAQDETSGAPRVLRFAHDAREEETRLRF